MKSLSTLRVTKQRADVMDRRQQLTLSQEDTQYLNANHPSWESLATGQQIVLLHDFWVPAGYTISLTTAAITIPAGYPMQGLDMAYFYPHLIRTDGQRIPQTETTMLIDGKPYQRWSRHYTITKWRSDEDSLATHVMAVRDWLMREFERRSIA